MNDEYVIPLRIVVEKAGWTSSEIREMLKNGLPTKEINGEMMTILSVLEFASRPKPPPVKDSEFNVPVGVYADAVSKPVEEIERNGYPEVRVINGKKYVSYKDYDYYLENRPRKPAYQHPRYSDDL